MNRIITLNDVEPAPLSIRHPLGVDLDLTVTVKQQNGAPVNVSSMFPQFVLLPRGRGGVRPYDMEVTDAVNGITHIDIPGSDLQDEYGYGIELYSRQENPTPTDPPIPTGLAAQGVLITRGSAYATFGPLSIINVPTVVGPPGPTGATGATGAQGPTGLRGSVWTTGTGAPLATGSELAGDMYLDEANGDVWRFSGTAWMRGMFE